MKNCLTIRCRLFLAISLTLVISYALLFTLSLISINRFTEKQIAKDLESSLRFAKSQYLARPEMVMEALKLPAAAQPVHSMFLQRDIKSLEDAVYRWTQSLDFLEMLTVFDSDRAVIVRKNKKNGTDTFFKGDLLKRAFERRQPFITTEILTRDEFCREIDDDVCMLLPNKKDVMVQLVIVPIVARSGAILGVVVAGDDLNRDSHLPYQQQKIFGKNVEMMITQQGERIASTMSKADALYLNLEPRVYQSLKGGYSFNGVTALGDQQFEMAADPLLNFKGEFIGAIAVALEKGQFKSIRHENLRNLLLSAAISLPFIFLLAFFFARQIALPLRRFSDAVAVIEAGDYTKRVSSGRSDEFGLLSAAFNRMAASLEEHDRIIISQNVQLANLNEELENRVFERTEALRIETETQQKIINSLEDGVLVIDSSQRLTNANAAAEKHLGGSLSVWLGEEVRPYFEKIGLDELFARLTADPTEGLDGETVIFARHQGRKLRFSLLPLQDEEGVYRSRLLGIRDVSREGEVDQMKSEFIATVSHELKTPLTSMKGSLHFILNKGKWLTGVEREMLVVCQRNTERLIRLITDILDISRIEAGKVRFSMGAVVTGELALYALEEVKKAALAKNISIVNDLGSELPQIYGDYDRLLQVFSHLLANAVKFSPPDSVVTMSAVRQGGLLAISVADNGKVIRPADRARLFTKFQQLGPAESGKSSGSGLGLAICREIIKQHGGNIYYSAGAAGGNVFTFAVPVYGETNGQG